MMVSDKYGKMVIDRVFFEANYPILFSCINEVQDLFLCVCCQDNKEGKKYLITKTDEKNIIAMLENKRSIRDAFLNSQDIQLSVIVNENVQEHDEPDWNIETYLPKEGEYLNADLREADDEILYFRKLLWNKQKREYGFTLQEEIVVPRSQMLLHNPRKDDLIVEARWFCGWSQNPEFKESGIVYIDKVGETQFEIYADTGHDCFRLTAKTESFNDACKHVKEVLKPIGMEEKYPHIFHPQKSNQFKAGRKR